MKTTRTGARRKHKPLFQSEHIYGDQVRALAQCLGMNMRMVFLSSVSIFMSDAEELLGFGGNRALSMTKSERKAAAETIRMIRLALCHGFKESPITRGPVRMVLPIPHREEPRWH